MISYFKQTSRMQGSRKQETVESLARLVQNYLPSELVAMLFGLVVGHLKLPFGARGAQAIQRVNKTIEPLTDNIAELLLSRRNAVGIVIEALTRLDNATGQQNIQSKIKAFDSIMYDLHSNVVMDQNYLNSYWQHQRFKEDEERRNEEQLHRLLMEEEENALKEREIKERFEIQCPICMVQIDPIDTGTLECGHIFHRACINMHMKAKIAANEPKINCPQEGCHSCVSPNDIYEFVDNHDRQKYESFTFNRFVDTNSSDTSWCPTAGCSAVFAFDNALDNYKCPICKKHYCLRCRCDYHHGMTCAEYRINNSYSEDDKKFKEFVEGSKYKQCPKCKFWVERSMGCNFMACRCGQSFCYECGGTGCPHGSCSGSGRVKI